MVTADLAPATITEERNPFNTVVFQFNPATIKFTKETSYRERPTREGGEAEDASFLGTKGMSLKLDLVLDDVESGGASVPITAERLIAWTNPVSGSADRSPPLLLFQWGMLTFGNAKKIFTGYLKSVNINYELFGRDGRPIRAKVSLTLKQKDEPPLGTNPSSGGLVPYGSHVVARGDTLASIAHGEYGRADRWRDVAEANDIDDPLTLRMGQVLRLPAASEIDGSAN